MTMASSRRSSSPFNCRRASSSPYSSISSSSSLMNGRSANRSCSSSASSFFGSANFYGVRSRPSGHTRIDSASNGSKICASGVSAEYTYGDDLAGDLLAEAPRSGDSISVTIRFRPLSEREFQRGDEIAWRADGDRIVRNEYNTESAYAFDKVFGPSASSDEVYDVAAGSVVRAAMEGVNGTVFAYGVTSSGKTHTMHGGQNSPGIIQLAIKDVFSIIQDTPGREFLLRVSYIEIYNEVINDLLDPTCQNLRVREDLQGTYVEGIKEEVVLSPGHALSFIAAGEEHRHVGSNNFNLLSSRSHTIFTLMIESSAHGDEYDGVIFSQLNLIDLAGSESSKTETTGLRRKEGSYINKSLLTLGTVIGKLSEGRASHIPYRDSKLTRLLQSSLSGHGHVSLICTVTPASSSMEETHNTLKFANRAKRVEIFASLNKIIDEKSLIKKYQREISTLKQELDHLKKGVITNFNHDEILSLKQQLEEGQVKMQSRLEEEEEAKSALMSRIQRLTKLILVSTKNNIPGGLSDPSHEPSFSLGEDEKLDTQCDSSLHDDSDSLVVPLPSLPAETLEQSTDIGQISSIQRIESIPIDSPTMGETTNESGIPISDEMDLLVEKVKMLAGEIALGTSTLKRLAEQSTNGSECSKSQVQSIENDIQEKQNQIRVFEQRITESGVASLANTSIADMQQAILRMMTHCNEKAFDLEIKSADNRVLQEQLQNKCQEVEELKEKLELLQQKFISLDKCPTLSEQYVSRDYVDEMKKRIHCQEKENDALKLENIQLSEDYSGLHVQNQKLAEESSYAKELASAAAVELKNLTDQITKLSMQNSRVEKELAATRELSQSRSLQNGNGSNRKHNDGIRNLRRVHASRGNESFGNSFDDFDMWTLDCQDLKMELQARKQREVALEAALAQREIIEDGYRKKIDDAKKREAALENDLANMWVLVAQLKKQRKSLSHDRVEGRAAQQTEIMDNLRAFDLSNRDSEEDCLDLLKPVHEMDEPLVVRLKARIQDMKEKDLEQGHGNVDDSSNGLFE